MKRILITGATGQVGSAVIAALLAFDGLTICAAVRDVAGTALRWRNNPRVEPVNFNFACRQSPIHTGGYKRHWPGCGPDIKASRYPAPQPCLHIDVADAFGFQQMADLLTAGLGTCIRYESPNPWHFYRTLRRNGREPGLIFVMLLHMLPRLTGTPPVTRTVLELTGHAPAEFARFVVAHRDELLVPSVQS